MTREALLKQLPELTKNYHPSPDVLQHISNITLCAVVGPSAVGKSTMIEHSGIKFVPSDTTRSARPGEVEGEDMFFRQDYDQVAADIKAGHFVQIALFATGDMYATKYTSYPESGVGIMPVMADVVPVFRNLGFKKTITVFVTPPSYDEWMRRININPPAEEQRAKRMYEARRSFEFALNDKEVHFILNDDNERAAQQLRDLLAGRTDSEREAAAHRISESLLRRLG